jgi:hypothetical protein
MAASTSIATAAPISFSVRTCGEWMA